jgi:hypothetical protein
MPTNPENAVLWILKASGNTVFKSRNYNGYKKIRQSELQGFPAVASLYPVMHICITPHLNSH